MIEKPRTLIELSTESGEVDLTSFPESVELNLK